MYTLNKIKETSDEYLVQNVNCIEEPVSIVLNSYNDKYKSLFLMYLKMIESYRFKEYKNIKEISCTEAIREVLKKEFLINLCCKNVDDISSFIESNIDKNNPIMILGNYRELYYSKYYKKEDWPHLFIIKGYNKEHKLYYILDSTQRGSSDENNYYDFVIPYNIIENMYESLNKKLFKNRIFYFESCKVNSSLNHKKMLVKCLEKIVNEVSEQPYYEIEIVDKSVSTKDGMLILDKLLENYNYKKVFYNELANGLSDYLNDNLYNEFILIKDELLNTWKKVANKITYNIYKNKRDRIQSEFNIAISCEKRMTIVFSKVLYELKDFREEENKASTQSFNFENNEDDIISIDENKNFIFNFNNTEIYNSWIGDDSPKVLFNNINDEIKFRIKINLIEYSETSKFFAGICIKTKNGSLFYWGINCGLSIRLEHTGVKTNIFEIPDCSNELILGINISKDKCKFEYSLGNIENIKNICINNIRLSDIDQYGFGCKTWDETEKIKFYVKEVL